MSNRASQPNTSADEDLRDCLLAETPRCFIMKAGAGSGKTTSLVKALSTILDNRGGQLSVLRRRVACITYTDVAVREIWDEVGKNPLVHVATIHSFFWDFIEPLQADIKNWVIQRVREKLLGLKHDAENFGPRVQARTKEKNRRDIDRYTEIEKRIPKVLRFRYGTGSDYASGLLGHDDIIKLVPELLLEKPLLRMLIAQKYPFVFIDESQDTMEKVVDAFISVAGDQASPFCLGFFGDPMQKIYATGVGEIRKDDWVNIDKPENFRCPQEVLKVANAIRKIGDGLQQKRGRMKKDAEGNVVPVDGTARLFVLPANDRRDEMIDATMRWLGKANEDQAWLSGDDPENVKILVLVHRMAARRLGFLNLYEALNDKAPEKFKNGFQDGTAWPVKPFLNFILPLAEAIEEGDEFGAIDIIRKRSPLLQAESLVGVDIPGRLAEIRDASHVVQAMMSYGSEATVKDVLHHLFESNLIVLDSRITSHLGLENIIGALNANEFLEEAEEGEMAKEVASMERFLNCKATEFWSYQTYIQDESPFSTQQGVKGAEFDRVLVILDEEEGQHVHFSYEKFFGIKEPSDTDRKHMEAGNDSTIGRTCRLFYVCCTRAMKDLAVVLFTEDPATAVASIRGMNIFAENSILTIGDVQPA